MTMELPIKAPVHCAHQSGSYKIEIENLSYKLNSLFDEFSWIKCFGRFNHNRPQIILRGVSCEARAGEITALAGPSGAGKSTLLEILAGKISPHSVMGRVLVNSKPMDSSSFRRVSGFVTQDDALFPLLTVQETLMYSALLRLKRGRTEADARVRVLMKELGLDHVSGSRIGKGSNCGISGGERRRVSIGVDLVHDPDVILIDEPTSGLDSASALHVVMLLKSMAVNQGKTIVITIHQPGFRILEQIDRVVLLCRGLVVHNGPLHMLSEKLKVSGHYIPRHVNVLEFSIDVVETLVSSGKPTFREIIDPENHRIRAACYNEIKEQNNSLLQEVLMLGERFSKNIFRTKQLFATRAIQALVAGLMLGTIYLNVGNKTSKENLQIQIGFFAFSLTFLLSSTTEGLPIFLQERRILMRESTRGAYRVSSYVLANFIVFLPFLLMVGLLFAIPVYWLVGLRREIDGFLYFSLVIWMVLLMSNSFVACFSALVPNFIMGTSIIAGLMGSFFLFSGYFITKEKIPEYWTFMHYLSLFKYPFECLMINEYGGERNLSCIDYDKGECNSYGSGFLRQQDLKESQKWSNLAVMMGFILGYRMLSFLILWYRCYRTRN